MGYSDMIANLDLAASILDEYFPQIKYTLYNTGEYILELEDGPGLEGELPEDEGRYKEHLEKQAFMLHSHKVMDEHKDTFRKLANED